MLKFGDKTKQPVKIDADHFQVKEASFDKPVNVMMVEITEDSMSKTEEGNMLDYAEKVKVVYLKAEEELLDFLNR